MDLEITPEPDAAERAAIAAALEAEEKEKQQAGPVSLGEHRRAGARRPRRAASVTGHSRAPFLHMWEECIRCNDAPAVDEEGYCGHCHWAVRAEVEEGFFAIREYLRAWARFDEWCVTTGRAAH